MRRRLKEIRSDDTVAEYNFTGIATKPKERVNDAIDRGGVDIRRHCLNTGVSVNVIRPLGRASKGLKSFVFLGIVGIGWHDNHPVRYTILGRASVILAGDY